MKLSLEEVKLLIAALGNRAEHLKARLGYSANVEQIREAKELQSRLHDERRRLS